MRVRRGRVPRALINVRRRTLTVFQKGVPVGACLARR